MKASIIISTNSNRTLFENFLISLSEYPTIGDYEIIEINDGGEYSISDEQHKQYGLNNVTKIDSDKKLGYGAANNLASEKAKCENLIFMNDDIVLKPDCLEKILDILGKNDIAAVQPKLIYPQNNLVQSTGHVFTKFTNAHALENSRSDSEIVNLSCQRQALTTALCATAKKDFIDAGKFSTEYYNAWEGMEYTLKLTAKGKKCWYESKAEAYHIRGGARNQYSLNEEAQSALFWAKWSNKINQDLYEIISKQLTNTSSGEYLLLNFSKLPDPMPILKQCDLSVLSTVSYTYISGSKSLDFFRCLPNSFCRSNNNIIYFANNYTQVKNNCLWFEFRSNNDDLIIDLSGNVVHTNSLIKG